MIKAQSIKNKLGEVNFRRKVSHQHLGNRKFYTQEYDEKQMLKVIKEKAERNFQDFSKLQKKGVCLSPYLEIGSGYGQAALVLSNKFKALGFASDLAKEPLLLINESAKKLKFRIIPKRIVCDALNLPFKANSIPFIFCYQTLHHFKDPYPVLKEIKRVLSPGGVFFFAEEPVAQTLNLPLWYRPTKLRWWEKILKFTLILPFISKIGKTEIDLGILEEAFPISTWTKALSQFDQAEAQIQPFPFGPISKLIKNSSWQKKGIANIINSLLLFAFGGGISGLAHKKGLANEDKKLLPKLVCPNCQRQQILKNNHCLNCGMKYKIKYGILTLLPKKLMAKLYP